jgi:hypothetical protein
MKFVFQLNDHTAATQGGMFIKSELGPRTRALRFFDLHSRIAFEYHVSSFDPPSHNSPPTDTLVIVFETVDAFFETISTTEAFRQ